MADKYQVQLISLDQIDKNPQNPETRGSEGDIKHLLTSITESGLFYPILVNQQKNGRFMIIEGHRRFAVFNIKRDRNPDFAHIPALVINVATEYETKIFREINETSKKLTGKQWLEVFALGASAKDLPGRLRPAIEALGHLFNREELKRLATRTGPSVHGLARRVAGFCDYDPNNPSELRRIVAWLINSNDSVNVRVAMSEGHVDKIKAAIGKGIRMSGNPYPDGEVIAGEAELPLAA
jgi:hypothetical protein